MEPVNHKLGNPLITAVIKYRFHPNTIATKEKCNLGLSFSFSQVERDEIMKKIDNLIPDKVTQSTGIPTKRIKENSDISGNFLFVCFLEIITIAFPLLFYKTRWKMQS